MVEFHTQEHKTITRLVLKLGRFDRESSSPEQVFLKDRIMASKPWRLSLSKVQNLIIQQCSFSDELFCHNDLRNSALVPQQPPAVLAKHVLAEIPKQVQEHFNKRGLAPVQSNGPEPPYLGGL